MNEYIDNDSIFHHLVRVRRGAEPIPDDGLINSESEAVSTNQFRDGFVSALSMIFLSEIADKTFFIAMIMAMSYNKFIVFLGGYSALVIMTILSCLVGQVVKQFSNNETYVAAVHILGAICFFVMAVQMFKEAYDNRKTTTTELLQEEAVDINNDLKDIRDEGEMTVRIRKSSVSGSHQSFEIEMIGSKRNSIKSNIVDRTSTPTPANGSIQEETSELRSRTPPLQQTDKKTDEQSDESVGCITKSRMKVEGFLGLCFNAVFVKAFVLTFIAEWGDRSQISTVTLATSTSMIAVALGACIGHFICTLGAIIFGSAIAKKVKITTLNIFGGILFVGFGAYSIYLAAEMIND